jgi:hypothetical protein
VIVPFVDSGVEQRWEVIVPFVDSGVEQRWEVIVPFVDSGVEQRWEVIVPFVDSGDKTNNHLSPKESLNSDGQQFHQYQQN